MFGDFTNNVDYNLNSSILTHMELMLKMSKLQIETMERVVKEIKELSEKVDKLQN